MKSAPKRKPLAKARAGVRRTRRTLGEWGRTVAIVWVVQLAVLLYFLLTQTWSTYWFCRDLYRPGYTLFAWLGQGLLPGSCFNLLSKQGVLTCFAAAALLYAIVAVCAFNLIRQAARK